MEKLLFRLILVPVTFYFLLTAASFFNSAVYRLLYLDLDEWDLSFTVMDAIGNFLLFGVVGWTLLLTSFEIANHFRPTAIFAYWLKILRYTPIAGVILSIPITLVFDIGMVQYSKREIRNYIYSNEKSVVPPDLDLHNTDRGWCGNGHDATLNSLYFDTAYEGMNDEDEYVRARSLLAAAEVSNWFNGGDRRFDKQLKDSCMDESTLVYDTADAYLGRNNSSCIVKLKAE